MRDESGLSNRHVVRDWVEAIARPPIPGGAFTLDDHNQFRRLASTGDIKADDWKARFNRMVASRMEILSELQSTYIAKQLKNLAGNLGDFGASQNTKYDNARSVYRSLLQMFLIKDGFRYSPMQETIEEAITREVHAITDTTLNEYVRARVAKQDAHQKAVTDPETLEEFQTFVRVNSESELTDGQLARYDSLQADRSRAIRAEKKQQDTVSQFESEELENLEFNIIEGHHKKRDCKLWIAQLNTRVERSTFNELKQKAKMLGGWYSSFVKSQAGFQFADEESAKKFVSLQTENIDRTEILKDRKVRKELTAAERLAHLANDLHRRAEETIEQSRASLHNTVRRSEMQAGIRGRAYADQATAKTIAKIAAVLETGSAKYLDGIRHKTQVEVLQFLATRAKSNRLQQKQKSEESGSYGDSTEQDRPIELADIRFAKYPYPTIYKRHLENAVLQTGRARGVQLASKKMGKRIRQQKGDFVTFSEKHDIDQLTDFLSRTNLAGHDTDWMERELLDFKRLQAANICTLPELRVALRELLPLLGECDGDSPVSIAERELIGKELPGFFPTPGSIINKMLDLAEIRSHHRVLEPSVGKGDIADAIRKQVPDSHLTVVEINRTLSDVLTAKGFDPVFGDFLTFGSGKAYDRIIMNPPFERSQEIDHVRHAYDLLASGGRIVSVMSEGPFFRADAKSKAFREWLETHGSSEKLPEESFRSVDAFRHTAVRTRLVVIDKK